MSINENRTKIGDSALAIMLEYIRCIVDDKEALEDTATKSLAAAKILYGEAV